MQNQTYFFGGRSRAGCSQLAVYCWRLPCPVRTVGRKPRKARLSALSRIRRARLFGRVQQDVQVTGDAVSAIETDTPTISRTFTTGDTINLPVNTRASFSGTSAASIFGALPGVQDDSSGISLQGALPY
jgi:hypothetical protein